ncbi:MAG: inorganic diphosphatase [Candidatus Altiarchaeota archaeon]
MRVVVETPKWSFVKYRWNGTSFVRDLISPFPNLFNYGFVEGTVSEDGMEQDALVLGGRLRQGDKVDYVIAGNVKLVDDGKRDDKLIFTENGRITRLEYMMIRLFYLFYPGFKRFYSVFILGRKYTCKFEGIIVNKSQ